MKKYILLTFLLLLSMLPALAQQEQSDTQAQSSEQVFDIVEKAAEPKGGMQAFYTFIGKNLEYPLPAFKEQIQGTVYLKFIIDEKGKAKNLEVYQGAHPDLDAEALRVLQLFNDQVGWKPAKNKGKAVAMQRIMPIKFKFASSPVQEE
jgi:periplasmic protein TonB